jgi:hypothetical protein
MKNLILSTCFTFAADEHIDVRSSGCGTIGVFVANSIIQEREDIEEVFECITLLCADPVLKVRIRAFWALGNVTDKARGFTEVKEIVSDNRMLQLLQITVDGCSDNDKVRSHALRTLGFLAELLEPAFLQRSIYLMSQVVTALLKNIGTGSFKVRWNACHCLKHMLNNPGFPIGIEAPYSQTIFQTLCEAAKKSMNFKVKIAAILALSTPSRIQAYLTEEKSAKENAYMILAHCVMALETADQAISKSSYDDQKYVVQFLEAIINAVAHFKALLPWDEDLKSYEHTILQLQTTLLQPRKTAFDSKGA